MSGGRGARLALSTQQPFNTLLWECRNARVGFPGTTKLPDSCWEEDSAVANIKS